MNRRRVGFGKLLGLVVARGKKERVAHMGAFRFGSIELANCVGTFIRHADEYFEIVIIFCQFTMTVEVVCRLDVLSFEPLLCALRYFKVAEFYLSKFFVQRLCLGLRDRVPKAVGSVYRGPRNNLDGVQQLPRFRDDCFCFAGAKRSCHYGLLKICGQVETREARDVTARQVHFNCRGAKENETGSKCARSPFTD